MEETTKQTSPQPSSKKGVWYVLAVVLLVLFIFGLASNKKQQNNAPVYTTPTIGTMVSPTKVPRVRTGLYSLALTPNAIKAGTTKTVTMNMDTAGKDVVGFDVILSYNPSEMTIGKISSSRPEFMVFQKETTPGVIALTVIKAPQINTPTIFSNSPALSIPVTPKTAGLHAIHLLTDSGKNEAKFVDVKTVPYYPTVGDVTIQSQ